MIVLTLTILFFILIEFYIEALQYNERLKNLIVGLTNTSMSKDDSAIVIDRKRIVNRLRNMIELYQLEHSRDSVLSNPNTICQRRFVFTRMICSHAGNRLQEFLIEFGWAVIYNRTFIVDFELKNCYHALNLQSWIVQINDIDVMNLAVSNGCPIIDPMNETSRPIQMRSKNVPFHCCNFMSSSHRVIFFGGPSANMIGLQQENSIPHPSMAFLRNRSNILFDGTRDSLAPLGFLSQYAFNFSRAVLNAGSIRFAYKNERHIFSFWRKSRVIDPFLIGVHVRHQKLGEEDYLDRNVELCLQTIRPMIPRDRKCVILLASDRLTTLLQLSKFAKKLKCMLKYVDRKVDLVEIWKQNKDVPFSEQGPWRNSATSMADFYFLSQSQLIIGTEQSTFSQLIASLSGARSFSSGKTANNFVIVYRKDPLCRQNDVRVRASRCRNDTRYDYNQTAKMCSG